MTVTPICYICELPVRYRERKTAHRSKLGAPDPDWYRLRHSHCPPMAVRS